MPCDSVALPDAPWWLYLSAPSAERLKWIGDRRKMTTVGAYNDSGEQVGYSAAERSSLVRQGFAGSYLPVEVPCVVVNCSEARQYR
jgi:hypothetical protein